MSTLLTRSQFAEHIGNKPSYVTELANAGRLVFDGDSINVEASLQRIKETADPSKQGVVERHAANRNGQVNSDNGLTDELHQKTGSHYQKAKAMRAEYEALMAKKNYEEKIAELLNVNDVVMAVMESDAVIKNQLENLPDALAPLLCAENDERKIKLLLSDYIENILNNLSINFKKKAKPC